MDKKLIKEAVITRFSIVRSLKGRDAGGYFMALGAPEEDGYITVADGKVRKLSSPKRKKLKHIADTGLKLTAIADKERAGLPYTDRELSRALKSAMRESADSGKK